MPLRRSSDCLNCTVIKKKKKEKNLNGKGLAIIKEKIIFWGTFFVFLEKFLLPLSSEGGGGVKPAFEIFF